jgi:uncharacterized protein (DUF1501 family)
MWAIADPLDVKATQAASGKDGKILVVVQLSGGNDGLNTVIPFADDAYRKARPQLGHDPKTVLKLNDQIALHPNLAKLKGLFDAGSLSIVQGVGYPNPNRSHFRSMDIWHSAQVDREAPTSGWLGRFFDNACSGMDVSRAASLGIALGDRLPLAMAGDKVQPVSFERPETYRYAGRDVDRVVELNKPRTDSAATPATSQLDFLRRTAMDAKLTSDQILKMTKGHSTPLPYPTNPFAQGLRTIAAMIAGGLPTRVYYVSLSGFDTHAQERGKHDGLMQQLDGALAAFQADLAAQKNDDRVLTMTFSEFGRRVEQNASGGTDHGAAAPMFLIGKAVKSGLVGAHPSLKDLENGDLRHAIDFRNVYAAVLKNWLDADATRILGPGFHPVNILAPAQASL